MALDDILFSEGETMGAVLNIPSESLNEPDDILFDDIATSSIPITGGISVSRPIGGM